MLQPEPLLPLLESLHDSACPKPEMFFNRHLSGYPFVTNNPHKVREYSQVFGYPIVNLKADLKNVGISREMWKLTADGDYLGVANEAIAFKAREAYSANNASPAACENTLLFIPRLSGFPSFFTSDIGSAEAQKMLYRLASDYRMNRSGDRDDFRAFALVTIGVYNPALFSQPLQIRHGMIEGRLVDSQHDDALESFGFDWDPCFAPITPNGESSIKSFGQMLSDQKNWLSMRRVIAQELEKNPLL